VLKPGAFKLWVSLCTPDEGGDVTAPRGGVNCIRQ
jgi:hypothetical protein